MKKTYLIAFLFACLQTARAQEIQEPVDFCDTGYDAFQKGNVADTSCYLRETFPWFRMEKAWSSPPGLAWLNIPIVGNLNPQEDSIPEILTIGLNDKTLYFIRGDGSNAANPDQLYINTYITFAQPALADLDGNDIPEMVFIDENFKFQVYSNFQSGAAQAMTLWAVSTDTVPSWSTLTHGYWGGGFRIGFADFNSDGLSEIYVGNNVFGVDLSNPAQPLIKRLLEFNGPSGLNFETNAALGYTSSVADLLSVADCNGDPDCEGLELACGYGIYSVDIDPNDGDGMEIKLKRNVRTISGVNFKDGTTTVADVNHDNIIEVVFTTRRNGQTGVCVWNKTGFWRFFPTPLTDHTLDFIDAVSIGNVFDDRSRGFTEDWPEILVRRDYTIYCYNLQAYTANPAAPYWWTNNGLLMPHFQAIAPPILFDFNNDGYQEMVLQDGRALHIVDGGTLPKPAYVGLNQAITEFPVPFNSFYAHPVVVDANGNGSAEIVAVTYSPEIPGSPLPSLEIIQAENPDYSRWATARQVWNQANYVPWQIEDDLRVPLHATLTADNRHENMANAQTSPNILPDQTPFIPSADLRIEIKNVECQLPKFKVTYEVCNIGQKPSADTIVLSFYRNGNPFSSALSNDFYNTTITTQGLVPGDCITQSEFLPLAGGLVYAVLNDAGLYNTPLPAGATAYHRPECDHSNNVATFTMSLLSAAAPNLGLDRVVCQPSPITLNPGSGFSQYLWQNGATTPSITVSTPGVYWVQTVDQCFNTRRDSIEIRLGSETQILQVDACAGASYVFNGQAIAAGNTQAFTYTNRFGCDSVVQVQVNALPLNSTQESVSICAGESVLVFGQNVSSAGLYSQTFQNANGCDSIHSVMVNVFPEVIPTQENISICAGESVLVFGQNVSSAGLYSQTFQNANGCDSIHSVMVNVFPEVIPTQENISICAGESVLVFGQNVSSAGLYSQTFQNANGCDSTHSVILNIFPEIIPTQENISICAGESVLIFGQNVSSAGLYSQTFQNANGCDSIHSVTVNVFPEVIPTQENISICAGESVLVFGQNVSSAGLYSQTFQNTNGCDSTHSVTVNVFPEVIPTQENISICAGESVLVFGQNVNTASLYSQTFQNINGCDSTHSVTVNVFPEVIPTQENISICAGESVLIFGQNVSSAGLYSQTFQNINGCDSTHSVMVNVFPEVIPTQESISICAGESVLVFGQNVNSAGLYSQTFQNANGCDSTHSVTVNVFPEVIPTQENISICAGESVLVFGQNVNSAGLYSQTFQNANGCDSIHSVTVNVFPEVIPTQESFNICEGDSILVFGQLVGSGGVFSRLFQNINGCDSLHTIQVQSVPLLERSDSLRLCAGDSLYWKNNWYHQAGTYTLYSNSITACDTLWRLHLQEINLPPLSFSLRQPDANDSTGALSLALSPASEYSLDGVNFSRDSLYPGLLPGAYVLSQQYEGCADTLHFQIFPFREIPQNDAETVYVPNVFAPDSGGDNAVFQPYFSNKVGNNISRFRIYDRWGEILLDCRDMPPQSDCMRWNGRFRGRQCPPGVYTWVLEWTQADGTLVFKSGTLTLIR
ncbi:MAG: gliding motility-associated C-terminal domain-containing protein [Chitinophagales bacterium]|nr:gliding motility-associated C-terminal domain-containing protein [Chitinophagales bacterium]